MANVCGKGTIVQLEKEKTRARCRKWQLRVNDGLNPRTGKYRTHTRRFSGTYTDATKELRKFIEEIESNQVQIRAKYTLQEYCDRYVERREVNKEISAATAHKLRSNFKSACKHLGHANITAITPEMLDDMYLAMLKGDTLSGRPSSGTHVRHIHNNLTLLFNQAVKEGVLVGNPCNGANPPRMDTEERHAIEPDKVREFVHELSGADDGSCAYMLAVCMGLRRGEICGLSWGDVDFDSMTIHVCHSVDVANNLKGTKTKAGDRILPMPDFVADALKRLHEAQEKRYEKLNRNRKKACHYKGDPLVLNDESPVISNISGNRLHPSTLSKWWNEERASFGLEGVTFHETQAHLHHHARATGRAPQAHAGARRSLRPTDLNEGLHPREPQRQETGSGHHLESLRVIEKGAVVFSVARFVPDLYQQPNTTAPTSAFPLVDEPSPDSHRSTR